MDVFTHPGNQKYSGSTLPRKAFSLHTGMSSSLIPDNLLWLETTKWTFVNLSLREKSIHWEDTASPAKPSLGKARKQHNVSWHFSGVAPDGSTLTVFVPSSSPQSNRVSVVG